ncbi:MAG: HAMP domain-containing histidine kinase [Epsilonproteobacteria bacterium]|nr:HAMP domain-containing histidine kinase [Campylobacterota bacterium]
MRKYEKEAFLKSFLIFFISLALLGGIISFFYYKERLHFIKDKISQEMWIYNYNFEDERFAIDFVEKKDNMKIGKLYINDEIYMYFPVSGVKDQYLKVIYPIEYYKQDTEIIFKDILFKYWIYLFVIFVFSIFYSLYSLYPLHYALNLLNEFLRDIIHDLNTPVSSMLLNIKMLKKKDPDSPQLKRLELGVKNIGNLYKNLEYFIKENSFEKKETDMKKLIEDKVEFFRNLYPHISFELDLEDKICFCEREALIRILDNIISNACKYNKKPYVVKITLKNNRLTIEDTGIGIKRPSKIFKRYYKEGERGLGIGLNIVKKLCDMMKIEIRVSSEIGRGTKFTLIFDKSLFEREKI